MLFISLSVETPRRPTSWVAQVSGKQFYIKLWRPWDTPTREGINNTKDHKWPSLDHAPVLASAPLAELGQDEAEHMILPRTKTGTVPLSLLRATKLPRPVMFPRFVSEISWPWSWYKGPRLVVSAATVPTDKTRRPVRVRDSEKGQATYVNQDP